MTLANEEMAKEILLLQTTCVSSDFEDVQVDGDNEYFFVSATLQNKKFPEDDMLGSTENSALEEQWNEFLGSAPIVCDLVILSSTDPKLVFFPEEELMPCGQSNLLVFPSIGKGRQNDGMQYQVSFSNCAMEASSNRLDFSDTSMEDQEYVPTNASSWWEVVSTPDTYQWTPGKRGSPTSLTATFDVTAARDNFFSTRMTQEQNNTIQVVGIPNEDIPPSLPLVLPLEDTKPVVAAPSVLPILDGQPLLPIDTPPFQYPFAGESSSSSTHRGNRPPRRTQNHGNGKHYQRHQLEALEGLIENELQQINCLLFFVGVIATVLVLFLCVAVWEAARTFVRSTTRAASSSKDMPIPSSIQHPTAPTGENALSSNVSPLSIDAVLQTINHPKEKPPMVSPERETPLRRFSPDNDSSYERKTNVSAKKTNRPRFVLRPVGTDTPPLRSYGPRGGTTTAKLGDDRSNDAKKKETATTSVPPMLVGDETVVENKENVVDNTKAPDMRSKMTALQTHPDTSFIADYWGD